MMITNHNLSSEYFPRRWSQVIDLLTFAVYDENIPVDLVMKFFCVEGLEYSKLVLA